MNFILKVFLLSAVISLLIKYALPLIPVPETAVNALIIIFSPTIVLALLLFWRSSKVTSINQESGKVGD
ncbi:MAG: hypothetical protein AAF378_22690 [Cyanobacteria bacterium P01_A01_bin.84]